MKFEWIELNCLAIHFAAVSSRAGRPAKERCPNKTPSMLQALHGRFKARRYPHVALPLLVLGVGALDTSTSLLYYCTHR